MEDGPEQSVAEIKLENLESGFWFAFDAEFEVNSERQHELFHVSLGVFHDIERELVPLVRADWHKLDAEGKSAHAQPHWHFVQRPAHIEGIIRRFDASQSNQAIEFSEETHLLGKVADCGRMHFAMTSLWEAKEPYKKRLFSTDDFPKWFDSLAQYIASQIRYLSEHVPPASRKNVQEFNPT